jgi:type II secretory pathway pseudopilin PulG
VEVVIATMIAAMTTTAVFSVILSSFVSGAKADKRDAAAMVLRRAQETLKSYVSVDPTNNDMFNGSLPVLPGAPGSPPGRWIADDSGVWALRNGTHDISSLLAGTPLYDPDSSKSSFRYTVSSADCGFGLGALPNYAQACKTVVFTLVYPD